MKFYDSFRKMIKHMFYSIDLFGHPIQLQIKKDSEYHSIIGLLMSLGILALIFYSFLSLLIDMFDRKSPNIIQNIQFQANPEEYQLKQESFLFYLALTDNNGIPITQQENSLIYLARFYYCQRDVDENNQISNNCSNFLLKPCNQVAINSGIQEKLNVSQAVLAASYCFDSEDWNKIELSLQGTPQSVIFKGLQFVIEKCNNETSAGNCAPQEQIEQKLSFAYLGLVVSDYVLNQQKTNNPFSMVSQLISTSLSTSQQKQATILMRKQKLFNSENFFYFFEEKTDYSALAFELESEWVLNTQQDQLINLKFYLDDREIIYYRTYNNIFDILGQMGGLLELMLFVVGMIIKPFIQLSCELSLVQEIFQFENNNPKLFPFEGLKQVEGVMNQSQLVQLKKFFKLKAQQIKLFVHQYLFTFGQDRQLIQQSIESIYNQIDIIFIINKLIEIDKLKKILLNEDQQILFNYIHKPKISLGIGEKMKASINQNYYDSNKRSLEEEILQAFNSYNMIKESNHNEFKNVNQSIITLLDKDVKLIFETSDNQKVEKQTSILQIQQISSINDLSLQDNRVDI